jgi:hypothetical protein
MNTENLIISEAPAAFADFAAKHNALVYLLANMTGAGGIKVAAAEGNIIVDGSGISVSAPAENGSFLAVGTDGKLGLTTKHSTFATATTYPTVLKVVNGSTNVLLDSNGLTVNDGAYTATILFADFARNLSIRTISVCDSGTIKSIDVLASAAY